MRSVVTVLAAALISTCLAAAVVTYVDRVRPPTAPAAASLASDPDLSLYRGATHIRAAQAKWEDLNELCRGGSGDDPKTLKACDEREQIADQLRTVGYCFEEGSPADETADHVIPSGWQACTPSPS